MTTPPHDDYTSLIHFPYWRGVMDAVGEVPYAGHHATPHDINERINAYRYIPERGNMWLTPAQFYAAGGGDCEDFAIAKLYEFLAHGYKDADLALCVVTRKADKALHCVLRVLGAYLDIPAAVPAGARTILRWDALYDRFEKNNGRSYWINRLGWGRL